MKHEHGTLVGYKTDRCRCDECRRANREYMRARRGGPADGSRRIPPTQELPARPWESRGDCAGDTEGDWFPPLAFNNTGRAAYARRVCMGCPVRRECLEYALDAREEFGIWGGLDEQERRNLRRRRQRRLRGAS